MQMIQSHLKKLNADKAFDKVKLDFMFGIQHRFWFEPKFF